MAVIRAFFILLVCLLLARQAFAKNEAPCQLSKWNNGYNTFVKRHICSVTQNPVNISNCIRNNGNCDRPTQSFLQPKDVDKVKGVCTSEGGVIYKENLCISRQSFTFVTVRIDTSTCSIKSVQNETKHLILACDRLDNQCLPVHFEGNPNNSKPNNNADPCQALNSEALAPTFKMTWLWLVCCLFVLLLIG
ncbi:hypothetical protein D9C73_016224 [Collichthys lucidus]|uniref:Uncharacterized protein n=1 Tax=Collichthys lucidus TaxID=240159 RepID=A0A4U5V6H4_COLLU|nr:hypothetical protein D9C73_016224 [Collichthys lucidus]